MRFLILNKQSKTHTYVCMYMLNYILLSFLHNSAQLTDLTLTSAIHILYSFSADKRIINEMMRFAKLQGLAWWVNQMCNEYFTSVYTYRE